MQMEGFRLSPQQRRLWQQQQGRSVGPYYARAVIMIEGGIAANALNAAIQEVGVRYEILRTVFQKMPGLALPVQVIATNGKPLEQNYDFTGLAAAEQKARVENLIREAGNFSFDLANGPVLRILQIRLSASQTLLLVAMPALCADAAALDILAHEISRAYAVHAGLAEAGAADGVMQYADIAEWQNELLESEDGVTGREFWRKQNLNLAELMRVRLPFENQAPAAPGFAPAVVETALPAEWTKKIEALAQQHAASPSTFLLACFNVWLWRLTEGALLVIGAGHDGRKYDELKNALGLFAKYLPLQIPLAADTPFNDVLARVHKTGGELHEREEFFSWEHIPNSNGKSGAVSCFPHCFYFAATPARIAFREVTFSVLEQHTCFDRFKLNLTCVPKDEALVLEFHYDANLFAAADIQRGVEQFQALVASALLHPTVAISALEMIGTVERQRLLVDFNRTAAELPIEKCIHHLIEAHAAATPDSIAVIFENKILTYGELNRRANQLAHYLRRLGVAPETFVTICTERSLEMIVGILGILKAGAAYVPMDPSYPQERLRFILADTQSPVLLTTQLIIDNLQLSIDNCKLLRLDADWDEVIAKESPANFDSGVAPQNLAYVIYTSGSTGKPKGVLVAHQNLVNSTTARLTYYREPITKFLLLSSFAFDSSVAGLFWTLCQGGALCLPGQGDEKDPAKIIDLIANNSISHLLCLPSLHNLILTQASAQQLASLHAVLVAGEACPQPLTATHHQRLAAAAFYNEYGPTEGTVWSSVFEISAPSPTAQVPIGRPVANAQIYLQDEHLHLVPIGVGGELCVGGAGVARGYLRRPELTAERFIPNLYGDAPGTRLYKTGDLARFQPDGVIDFLGRLDHQVKIRGYRIELEEIEVVLNQHPALQDVVVHAREDTPGDPSTTLGTGKRLVAYLTSNNGAIAANDLRDYLAAKLPDYMTPSAFVFLEALPLMPNGKVDRKALPAPEAVSTEKFVAPRTPVEEALAAIWSEVLKAKRVGVNDNYFELGGDSILTIRIITKAREKGITLTPRQFFQHQTIAELAEIAGVSKLVQAEQGAVTGAVPLTPIQQWFFAQNPATPDYWNMTVTLELERAGDPAHWEKAVQALLAHHDALRLRFSRDAAGDWQQTVAPLDEKFSSFIYIDLSKLVTTEQEQTLARDVDEWKKNLSLSQGPLIRVVLFDFGAQKPARLLVVIHHLAVDVVSWQIILDDLRAAYQQASRGEAIKLPAKTTSYKRWAERLAEYAKSATLRDELAYWLAAERMQAARLPVDFADGDNTMASAQTVSVALSAEETQALLQEVQKVHRAEMNDVLLTALGSAFSRWTKKSSLLVSLEGHGREDVFEQVDVSRTVGWFTALYPMLLKVQDAANAIASLQAVKVQLRLLPNRGLGHGVLRYLNPNDEAVAKLRALPPAEVNFNYLGQLNAEHLSGATPFSLARDENGKRDMLLEFVGFVVNNRLQMNITYSKNMHHRATIENLGQNFLAALRSLLAPEKSSETNGYRAADFSEANLSREEFDDILAEIN